MDEFPDIFGWVDEGPRRYRRVPGSDAFECSECSAWVSSPTRHNVWHAATPTFGVMEVVAGAHNDGEVS